MSVTPGFLQYPPLTSTLDKEAVCHIKFFVSVLRKYRGEVKV
jgi:hypothetical protein